MDLTDSTCQILKTEGAKLTYLPGLDKLWRILASSSLPDTLVFAGAYLYVLRLYLDLIFSFATSHLSLDAALSHLKNSIGLRSPRWDRF